MSLASFGLGEAAAGASRASRVPDPVADIMADRAPLYLVPGDVTPELAEPDDQIERLAGLLHLGETGTAELAYDPTSGVRLSPERPIVSDAERDFLVDPVAALREAIAGVAEEPVTTRADQARELVVELDETAELARETIAENRQKALDLIEVLRSVILSLDTEDGRIVDGVAALSLHLVRSAALADYADSRGRHAAKVGEQLVASNMLITQLRQLYNNAIGSHLATGQATTEALDDREILLAFGRSIAQASEHHRTETAMTVSAALRSQGELEMMDAAFGTVLTAAENQASDLTGRVKRHRQFGLGLARSMRGVQQEALDHLPEQRRGAAKRVLWYVLNRPESNV